MDSSPHLAALVPRRLGASTTDRPELPEAFELVADQAADWQRSSTRAELWEASAMLSGSDKGRAYALAGQMGALGEQLALAYAAAADVHLWRSHRDGIDDQAAAEMSMRGMAEAEGYFVVAASHALANVAMYALSLSAALRELLIPKLKLRDLEVFSEHRLNWITLTPPTVKAMAAVAAHHESSSVIGLIEPVVDYGTSEAWLALYERRGEDFHRWRPQSAGLQGASKRQPWVEREGTTSLSIGPRDRTPDDLLEADQMASIADRSLLALAWSLERFGERWTDASGHLGGPRFRASGR